MKWIDFIQWKIKIALLLTVVLAGVLVKNIIDRKNVSELGNSFSSVYEDRLLVESYIYQLSDHLYQKKIMMDQCRQTDNLDQLRMQIAGHNKAIQSLIQEYAKTKLTPEESFLFLALKKNIDNLSGLENKYFEGTTGIPVEQTSLDQQFSIASGNLHQLSSIQLEEAKNLTDYSKKIVAGSSILTQFELAMIIVIGLIIQAMIFASKVLVIPTQQHHLN